MNYLNIGLDSPVSIFDICQAHSQLESDYSCGGRIRERPSNRRRMEATSCQLSRLGYADTHRWVDICDPAESDDSADEAVRDIYLRNVLRWGLPIDVAMMAFIKNRYTTDFISQYPQCAGAEYLPGVM